MTFDVQEARAAYEKIQHKAHICTDYDVFAAATYLPVALDEIERLRAENAGWQNEHEAMHEDAIMQAKRIAGQVGDIKKLKEDLSEVWQVHDEQAKRIAELEGNLVTLGQSSQLRFTEFQSAREKQHAALKELGQAKRQRGKALVEERACLIEAGGEPVGKRISEEDQKDLDDLAREQLRQEGKL